MIRIQAGALKKTALWFLVGFLGIKVVSTVSPWGLGYNNTTSIPKGLYLKERLRPNDPLAVGEYVCHTYVAPEWAADRDYAPDKLPVCKPVAALPGDKLEVTGKTVAVYSSTGEYRKTYTASDVDSKGRPVPFVLTSGVVKDQQVILISDTTPLGLDSRYFGPRWRHEITMRIYPLITWGE